MTQSPTLYRGYVPGCIGRVTELHARYYASDWNFGPYFEAKVAAEMSEFVSRYNETRDAIWTVQVDNVVEGSITIDGEDAESEGAHLRWFIMSDALRGQGMGKLLVEEAVTFSRACGYQSIYLWTFSGLHAARKLYEQVGFELAFEAPGDQWGNEVREQKFVLTF